MQSSRTGARRAALLVVSAALAGCATVSKDAAVAPVQNIVQERLGAGASLPSSPDAAQASDEVQRLLAQPLSPDAAVQVALLDHPAVRASLAELGIAAADLVQAGRLANPRFVFGSKRNADGVTIDRTLLFNVMSLVVLPLRRDVAAQALEAAQWRAAAGILARAGAVRRAWYEAVAAQQRAGYFEEVKSAADASAELARRMAAAGNLSALAQMREQAFQAEAETQLAKARQAALVGRERLTRLLGLADPGAFTLPPRLPDLVAVPADPGDVERIALERRLDIRLAKRNTAEVAASLGLLRATRFVNVLDAGYANESETGAPRKNGYEIEIEVPLFDWGDARIARAEAIYMQSVSRTAEVALAARSEVRERLAAYRASYEVARGYRDVVLPLRKRIADENVLRYNAMLIGVFELLADAREQIAAVTVSIDALRDFWVADTDLQLALHAVSPGDARPAASPSVAADRAAAHR
ncbi:MAG: TolC family protein [Rudaea sp.]